MTEAEREARLTEIMKRSEDLRRQDAVIVEPGLAYSKQKFYNLLSDGNKLKFESIGNKILIIAEN